MTRRTWVQIGGKLIDRATLADEPIAADSGALWGDEQYRGMQASDGTPIDTRTKHRDYMRARGITTIDDFTNTFAKSEQDRARIQRGEDPQRVHDIIRAIEHRR